ncbi:hypothetical protein PAXRUDRAFT_823133 [Paxillus rubicundulus Ve08.2h10]|uniref:Uncharacterized protein n=1 Tax=Paxillus rubicundulus Ve08.2h10 TaxID=930991 RepID=A0A0D0E451_9AGAM|nr:hypothetical protein PAXRUDRAFT_823133 [Paxillus rubicundulus Ve08.2h10]
MTNVKSPHPPHPPLTTDTATIRRKPAFTNQSPAANTPFRFFEKFTITSVGTASSSPRPKSPQNQLLKAELSERGTATYRPSRRHMTTLLPLYHPFGALALSLPDLDPTAFGLPAPVAVFDDPTRRSSNRTRRPAAKVRDANEAATPPLPPFIEVIPTPEVEPKDKPSLRKRRPAGGSKRKRKEPEDGDATYPAKRFRNPRSSGAVSAAAPTRTPSGEEVSPPASVGHSGASPATEVGQGDPVEEKKHERRTTRSRGARARRDSTASEATVASVSASLINVTPRVVIGDETMEIDGPTSSEATAPEGESGKADSDTPVPQQQ